MNRSILFSIIEHDSDQSWARQIYSVFMLIVIVASIVPLMFYEDSPVFDTIEFVSSIIFIIDYIARLITSDLLLHKGRASFFIYPFTPMAIIDLLSILPFFNVLGQVFVLGRSLRLIRVFRIFKLFKYSNRLNAFINVIRKEKNVLLAVLGVAIFYIFFTALVMFNVEPRINPTTGEVTFENFFDALYWATVTLTTVGYGDLCPVTAIGRCVSMFSALFGVAIIALPSGVITASYLDELREIRAKKGQIKKDDSDETN